MTLLDNSLTRQARTSPSEENFPLAVPNPEAMEAPSQKDPRGADAEWELLVAIFRSLFTA